MARAKPKRSAAFRRAARQPLMLGLFMPHQQGAWSPSTAPRGTSWSFDYNARCAVLADELGFDIVFALAQWLGKGGYGGKMRFRENAIDPFITSAGLAPLTKNVLLIATVHILYGWHPLHLAKYGAVIDHMSGGRWGLNVVTGYKESEFRMFGLAPIPHDERYARAAEFTEIMQRLWSEDEELTFKGRWWQCENAFVAPKPEAGNVVLVNAASSPAGIDYATSYSDLIFVTSPAGANPEAACAALPAHTKRIRQAAREKGRRVKIMINPHVICRETEAEARAQYERILAAADPVALDNFVATFMGGDQASWRGHSKSNWAVGGNVHLVGSPEQIVDWFLRLKKAGCDGMQINFFDFLPDLAFFGERVLPLLYQAGLRKADS
jgi:alkanesulfonate monooxygenase SsuD/methylene tetrahydromethanopterin reductase-like flavin-dependent oxidoreductase (luciferase family)